METKTQIQNQKSEISLRTLASDEQSLAAGNKMPVPKTITADLSRSEEPGEDVDADQTKPKTSRSRQIVLLLIFLAIVAIGYFYVYPMVMEVYQPRVN